MKGNRPGLSSAVKEVFGFLIITLFSLFWTIGAANDGGSTGFLLFGGAATLVGICMIFSTLKKAFAKAPVEEETYEPGPWLREFDAARGHARTCPNCGAVLGKQEEYCFKCKSVIPAELEDGIK